MGTMKERASLIINNLANDATWEDLEYQIYLRKEFEKSQEDISKGRLYSQDKIEEEFLEF